MGFTGRPSASERSPNRDVNSDRTDTTYQLEAGGGRSTGIEIWRIGALDRPVAGLRWSLRSASPRCTVGDTARARTAGRPRPCAPGRWITGGRAGAAPSAVLV